MIRDIRIYETARGSCPIRVWLEELQDLKAKRAVYRRIDRIVPGNFGDHKFIGSGVWEMRIVFMDGRKPQDDTPDSKAGFSTGRWEGDTLIVETTHLSPATITNNGLSHSNQARVLEHFRLNADATALLATQEFEDTEMLDNRGARFITWKKKSGDHVYPYECDPTFAIEYQNQPK